VVASQNDGSFLKLLLYSNFTEHRFVLHWQLIFIFSWFYIRFYQDHAQSEVSSTLTAIVALAITLLTTALVPVDIFIVSYMKNDDGTWKV